MAVVGVDVSKWQREMDWQKTLDQRAAFAFVRAGSIDQNSGEVYEDWQFQRNAQLCPPEIKLGYYFYARPNFPMAPQAQYFASLINGKRYELPPVLDIETTGGLGLTAMQVAVATFLDTLEAETGWTPIVYTRATFWNPSVGNPIVSGVPKFAKYLLWVARYTSLPHPWNDRPTLLRPYPWHLYEFWQYGTLAVGYLYGAQSAEIDMNIFNGTPEEFATKYGSLPPDADPMIQIELRLSEARALLEAAKRAVGE